VLFVCCVLLYNQCHRVKTHLQLINIALHYIKAELLLGLLPHLRNLPQIQVTARGLWHFLIILTLVERGSWYEGKKERKKERKKEGKKQIK
jgi:hypothetical protein